MPNKVLEVGGELNRTVDKRYRSTLQDFIYYEIYKTTPYVRGAVDIIGKRGTRDKYRIVEAGQATNASKKLDKFLDTANPGKSFMQLLRGILNDLGIYGRSYLYVEKTAGGRAGTKKGADGVYALWGLDTRITFPVTDGNGEILYHVQNDNGRIVQLAPDEVIYFSLDNAGSESTGLSPIETLIDVVAMEKLAQRFNSALFENHMSVGMMVSVPDTNEERAAKLQERLEERHTTPENAHRPLVLFGGATLVKDGAAHVGDIQFDKVFQASLDAVCAVYGVHKSKLGFSEDTNKASSGQYDKAFWNDTVRPLLRLVFEAFTRQFIRLHWQSETLEMIEPLQNILPTIEELEAAKRVAEMGAPFNIIQQLMNLPPVDKGDAIVMLTPGGGYARLDSFIPGLANPKVTEDEARARLMEIQAMAAVAAGGTIPTPEAMQPAPPVEEGAPTDGTVPADGQQTDGGDGQAAPPADAGADTSTSADTSAEAGAGAGAGGRIPAPTGTQADADAQSRIIDLTRSALETSFAIARAEIELQRLVEADAEAYGILRRVPVHPGSRGGTGYYDAAGVWHYGAPAAARANAKLHKKQEAAKASIAKHQQTEARKAARAAETARKRAAHQKEMAAKKAQRDKERAQKAFNRDAQRKVKEAARQLEKQKKQQMHEATSQARDLMSEIADGELNETEAFDKLVQAGWGAPADGATDAVQAQADALALAKAHPDMAVAVLHIGDGYYCFTKPLTSFGSGETAGNITTIKDSAEAVEDWETPSASLYLSDTGSDESADTPHGTRGEVTHPYMSKRIAATKAAVDTLAFRAWHDKIKQFTN